ncbi:MAG: sigma-70 family RNA polymerase sigma factor [Spirochaetales bacterium]|nr:sigma-70 family RNA polymerase sigma factor [Spirochaetales bacterium]
MAVNVEEFYRKYGPMVLRRCRSLLQNEDEALDAMQEVFVQVLRKQEVLNDKAPSSLLYTIATNTCLNVLRSNKRKPLNGRDEYLVEIAGWDNPEERVMAGHFADRLFSEEKDSTRLIAVLHYVDGFTLEETAEKVGLSVSGVRKRLRGLRKKGLSLKEV